MGLVSANRSRKRLGEPESTNQVGANAGQLSEETCHG